MYDTLVDKSGYEYDCYSQSTCTMYIICIVQIIVKMRRNSFPKNTLESTVLSLVFTVLCKIYRFTGWANKEYLSRNKPPLNRSYSYIFYIVDFKNIYFSEIHLKLFYVLVMVHPANKCVKKKALRDRLLNFINGSVWFLQCSDIDSEQAE